MTRFKLGRRTMLRGMVGGSMITAALPLLEAMLNDNGTALAGGGALPRRLVTYYWADGVLLDRWEPDGTGTNWTLSEELAPLGPVKDYLNVVTGLDNRVRSLPFNQQISHHDGMTVFNGYPLIVGGGAFTSNSGGPTVDQLAADVIATDTTVRAVHVQNSKEVSTDGDGGTTFDAISHRGTPGNLVSQIPQKQPSAVWNSLFGNFSQAVDTRPPRVRVLDAIREDAARLRKRLGKVDQQRLDAHLTAVDELQVKIEASTPSCALPSDPGVVNGYTGPNGGENISEVQDAFAHLIAQAFVCDITRVATFMFKHFVSYTTFNEIGLSVGHHAVSHDPQGGDGNESYHQGVIYTMQKLSDFLQVLQSYEEIPGQSNLLDSTIVYASTECSTPWSHDVRRQPILFAGHGNGYLKYPGVHYTATPFAGNNDNPNTAGNTSDALFTCLKAFVPDATSVGASVSQSSTTISEILA